MPIAAAGGVEDVLFARCTSPVHELSVSDRATYPPVELGYPRLSRADRTQLPRHYCLLLEADTSSNGKR